MRTRNDHDLLFKIDILIMVHDEFIPNFGKYMFVSSHHLPLVIKFLARNEDSNSNFNFCAFSRSIID
jgi:hypothetical protein